MKTLDLNIMKKKKTNKQKQSAALKKPTTSLNLTPPKARAQEQLLHHQRLPSKPPIGLLYNRGKLVERGWR
jgi:hypothetical protein